MEVLTKLGDVAGHVKAALRRHAPPPPAAATPRSAPRPSPVVPPPPPPPAKPAWASAIGTDKFGDWADIAVAGANGRTVTQRLRAIPAGKFRMGSPNNEAGRDSDEGPVHAVDIREEFWLFDTPCTQELWQAVTGKNPSRFNGSRHPVEKVSFTDVTAFMTALNRLVPGLDLTLPSEAQWEYACRAGTTGPTYAKPGRSLDDLAWYGANSGRETHDLEPPGCCKLYARHHAGVVGPLGQWSPPSFT